MVECLSQPLSRGDEQGSRARAVRLSLSPHLFRSFLGGLI
eukprot:COSAG03_NODE_12233_length_556_cov_0.770241_1_plen_39_part_01